MYKVFDLSQKNEWRAYIEKLPLDQQDVYYTPEYYELYENYGDGKAQCFVFKKENEVALYPFLLNSINELGYKLNKKYFDIQGAYGYNGVVSSSYSSDFIYDFYTIFQEYCGNKNIIAEFTRFNPFLTNHNFSQSNLQLLLNRKTAILNLNESVGIIWQNSFSSKNRNKIRMAIKKGYSVIIDNSKQGVRDFFRIYLETMKRIEADSYYYFNETMFHSMIRSQMFKFLFVEDNNSNRVATMILIIYRNYAHYHLSGRNIDRRDNSVSNLMLYEAIKIAKENGVKKFHFGGGNTLDENDSLFRFKKGFSKSYLDFFIGKKVHNQKVYNKVISQWQSEYPESYQKNANKLLGYRDI